MPSVQSLLRKLVQAGAIIALLTGTASSQNMFGDSKRLLTQEEVDKKKAIEKDYKPVTEKIPERIPTDPWGSIRPGPPAASKAKQPRQ